MADELVEDAVLDGNAVAGMLAMAMGVDMTTKGLAIMLIGGLGSVYGAMAGGLLLGIVEVISVAYLASSYRDAFTFSLMILVLLLRPRGLFSTGVDVER